jgi:hypothetical protein
MLSADLKWSSAFAWRGLLINDEAVLQPSVTYSIDAFSINAWGSWDLTETGEPPLHTRLDLVLDYNMVDDFQIVTIGVEAHLYRDEGVEPAQNTYEIFGSYTLNGPLLPTLAIYYDVAEVNGLYGSFSVSHPIELGAVRLDLAARLGAGDAEYVGFWFKLPEDREAQTPAYVPDDPAGLDLSVSAALGIPVWKKLTLTPEIEYMRLMNSELRTSRKAIADLDSDLVIFSLTLGAAL